MASRTDEKLDALRPLKFTPEAVAVASLLDAPPYDAKLADEIEARAADMVEAVRDDREHRNLVDRFMAEYGLTKITG